MDSEAFDALILRELLEADGICAPIDCLAETDSTNSEAERQLAGGRKAPFVILARKQHQGRGRMGHSWHSPDEGNAYMSFAFDAEPAAAQLPLFTLWMGLAFCRELCRFSGLPVQVKWPNDLVLEGKKIGGILAHAKRDSGKVQSLVFGLGLNINSQCRQWPGSLPEMAGSLAAARGKPLPINQLLARLIGAGLKAYEACRGAHYEAELRVLWQHYDALAGRKLTARNGETRLEGTAEGIDSHGGLLLRLDSGETIPLYAGEVSLGSHTIFNETTRA